MKSIEMTGREALTTQEALAALAYQIQQEIEEYDFKIIERQMNERSTEIMESRRDAKRDQLAAINSMMAKIKKAGLFF